MENPTLQRTAERNAENLILAQRARLRGSTVEVVSDVARLPLSIVNLYFYGERGAGDRFWAMIDAGLPFSAGRIVHAAAERFGTGSRPAAIILTHGHFDHVGALSELADLWDVPIFAHEMEIPYLSGLSSYPPPDPAVGGGAMSFFSRFYPRGPIDVSHRIRPLPADGRVPAMPGWRWTHTPGHTPGHIALFRNADRMLLAGDAFVTQRQESAWAVLTQRPQVCRPPAYYTSDWPTARRSVERLARLQPEIAATGHGVPMHGERLRRQLAMLLRDWDRLAVPSYGRYVRQPAIADERGVVAVPSAVVDPQLLVLAGVGIAAALGTFLFASLKRRKAES